MTIPFIYGIIILQIKTHIYINYICDANDNTITYDDVGNPLNYYINDYEVALAWKGRKLIGLEDANAEYEFYFEYNDEGIRTSKTLNDIEYKYTLNGTQIVSQEWEDKLMVFFYDESGAPIGYGYRTTSMATDTFYYYIYEKNLQGDIVAIYNTSGTKLVSYTYDAWGNVTTTNHNISGTNAGAQYNPFRYRSYYYDEEVRLYYLNSRYYDPRTGRFLNADNINVLAASPNALTDKNLYAYCDNNPIMRVDYNGKIWNTLIGAVAGALVGGFVAAISGNDIKAGMVSGAISGAVSGAAIDIAIATGGTGLVAFAGVVAVSAAGGALSSYTNQRMNGVDHNNINWETVVIDGIWGGVGGALSFGMADVGGATAQTLRQILSQPLNKIGIQIVNDLSVATVITFGTWLNGTRMATVGG